MGFDAALWCIKTVEGFDTQIREFAMDCAEALREHMTDQRSLDALDTAIDYAARRCVQVDCDDARHQAMRALCWEKSMVLHIPKEWGKTESNIAFHAAQVAVYVVEDSCVWDAHTIVKFTAHTIADHAAFKAPDGQSSDVYQRTLRQVWTEQEARLREMLDQADELQALRLADAR